jgi:hypothetical protein
MSFELHKMGHVVNQLKERISVKFYNLYTTTIIISLLNINLQAAHNFELINDNPKIPIHVQANGGPWQLLDEKHYRYPVNVKENQLLIMVLSANEDKSSPISILFTPERVLEAAQQAGHKTTEAPTFYVSASIVSEKILGTGKSRYRVQLTPQRSEGAHNKTKFGLPLDNNVTQDMIDAIVKIETEAPAPAEQKESETAVFTTEDTTPPQENSQDPTNLEPAHVRHSRAKRARQKNIGGGKQTRQKSKLKKHVTNQ